MRFLFANHQGPSVDSYREIRGRKNYTCAQLGLPFNLTVVPLSDYVLLKMLWLRHVHVGLSLL